MIEINKSFDVFINSKNPNIDDLNQAFNKFLEKNKNLGKLGGDKPGNFSSFDDNTFNKLEVIAQKIPTKKCNISYGDQILIMGYDGSIAISNFYALPLNKDGKIIPQYDKNDTKKTNPLIKLTTTFNINRVDESIHSLLLIEKTKKKGTVNVIHAEITKENLHPKKQQTKPMAPAQQPKAPAQQPKAPAQQPKAPAQQPKAKIGKVNK